MKITAISTTAKPANNFWENCWHAFGFLTILYIVTIAVVTTAVIHLITSVLNAKLLQAQREKEMH